VNPLRITGADILFRGRDGEKGHRLFARRQGDFLISRWEPLPHELEILNRGGNVELRIVGHQQPALAIGVALPDHDESNPEAPSPLPMLPPPDPELA
jgi:hypothetical protein